MLGGQNEVVKTDVECRILISGITGQIRGNISKFGGIIDQIRGNISKFGGIIDQTCGNISNFVELVVKLA
ncbi:hypothetical protein H5P36_17585 [Bacillus sp. APMAM]|nr:hypothetical protein [Bacillus sp. APMAM]RTZ54659.1 hypothetical protein EKO25_16820 [Bacillus sp. SAJ1]